MIAGMDRLIRSKGAIDLVSHYRVVLTIQDKLKSYSFFFAFAAMDQNIKFETCLPRCKQTIGSPAWFFLFSYLLIGVSLIQTTFNLFFEVLLRTCI